MQANLKTWKVGKDCIEATLTIANVAENRHALAAMMIDEAVTFDSEQGELFPSGTNIEVVKNG